MSGPKNRKLQQRRTTGPKKQHTPPAPLREVCDCEKVCVLCGVDIAPEERRGCNPWPVAHTGRCCYDFDKGKVLPARMGINGPAAVAFGKKRKKRLQGAVEKHEPEGGAK